MVGWLTGCHRGHSAGGAASERQMLKMLNGHTLSRKLADSFCRLTMLLILKQTRKHAHQYVPVLHSAS